MLTLQFEGGKVVVKFIVPIMAGETIRTEGQGMHFDKDNIHFAVTILTGVGYEFCYILSMTITANNRFIPSLELVIFQ